MYKEDWIGFINVVRRKSMEVIGWVKKSRKAIRLGESS
jgi:hypothetical protein